jgi:hypothetical protein
MRKFPAVFSVPVFSSISKTLNAFSRNFRDKRTKENFITLCFSIILSGSTLLSGAVQISSYPKDIVKALSHFLQSSSWSTHLLDKMRLSLIQRRLAKKKIKLVVLDWTALVKTGRYFEYLSLVHDARDDKIKPGYTSLLAIGITEDEIKIPIHQRLVSYQHNFRGENIEIYNFLDDLVLLPLDKNELKNAIFLFDRGFDRMPVVKKLFSHQLLFVIQAKKNKTAMLKNGRKLLLSNLGLGFYQGVLIKRWRLKLNIKVERAWDKKERKWKKFIWFTNLNENQFSATKVYRWRWNIEETIKELKQRYGLEKFRVRKWSAI